MDMENAVQNAIYAAIEEMNLQRPPDQHLSTSPETILAGDGGLDSLGLVNFVVLLEEKMPAITGKDISLISDGMDFQGGGVFATVRTLKEYIIESVGG
jgi:acyl carrier protein